MEVKLVQVLDFDNDVYKGRAEVTQRAESIDGSPDEPSVYDPIGDVTIVFLELNEWNSYGDAVLPVAEVEVPSNEMAEVKKCIAQKADENFSAYEEEYDEADEDDTYEDVDTDDFLADDEDE